LYCLAKGLNKNSLKNGKMEKFYILLMIIGVICYLGFGLNMAFSLDLKDPKENLNPKIRLAIIFFWFFFGIYYAFFGISEEK
jgi:uncharacterized membrane protein YfcA